MYLRILRGNPDIPRSPNRNLVVHLHRSIRYHQFHQRHPYNYLPFRTFLFILSLLYQMVLSGHLPLHPLLRLRYSRNQRSLKSLRNLVHQTLLMNRMSIQSFGMITVPIYLGHLLSGVKYYVRRHRHLMLPLHQGVIPVLIHAVGPERPNLWKFRNMTIDSAMTRRMVPAAGRTFARLLRRISSMLKRV